MHLLESKVHLVNLYDKDNLFLLLHNLFRKQLFAGFIKN
jgi:hypothetical protein